jgi:hypothetical protein
MTSNPQKDAEKLQINPIPSFNFDQLRHRFHPMMSGKNRWVSSFIKKNINIQKKKVSVSVVIIIYQSRL